MDVQTYHNYRAASLLSKLFRGFIKTLSCLYPRKAITRLTKAVRQYSNLGQVLLFISSNVILCLYIQQGVFYNNYQSQRIINRFTQILNWKKLELILVLWKFLYITIRDFLLWPIIQHKLIRLDSIYNLDLLNYTFSKFLCTFVSQNI